MKLSGSIEIIKSWIKMVDCTFKNNYSSGDGGSLYFNDNYTFDGNNLKIYNSTSEITVYIYI